MSALLWFCVVSTVSARVFHQPDGIISIITELEPEKAPVTYLQSADSPAERTFPVVVENSPSPPLAEGEFRVRSTKIRVVNPETGFKVVHEATKEPEIIEAKDNESVKRNGRSETKNEIKAEPANDIKIIYPSRPRYSGRSSDYKDDLISFNDNRDFKDDRSGFKENRDFQTNYRRQRKPGKYGYQTPRQKDNMVRTEKTTRVRNNNEPPQIIKETIVRPATQQDSVDVLSDRKKPGKRGRFVKYKSQAPAFDRGADDQYLKRGTQSRSSNSEKVGRYGKYIPQDRETQSENTIRFRTSQLPAPSPIPAVGEVVDESSAGSDLSTFNTPKKSKKEYSTSTVVRFPDGYAKGDEKRVESSSNYKTASNSRNDYRSPAVTLNDSPARKFDAQESYKPIVSSNVDVDHQPVPQASYVSSGVDESLADDDGIAYRGGGYDDGVGVGIGVEHGGIGLGHGGIGVVHGGIGGSYGGGLGDGFEKEKHFEKDKGKHYVAGHQSAHGAKGQKGYNNDESFSKGQSEQHGHDENKGYSKEKEGEKKSHLDKSSQFAAGHHAAEGAKASDFHRDKGHRKGHKKSGFRTVTHKDEYNKKEEFFDEEHDSAGVHKEGHNTEEHADKHGGKEKKAYLDAGQHHASRGHEGGHEKGHGYHQNKGHQQEKGHSGHYGHEEDYGKKSGHKEGEVHGHSEYGGGYHG